MSSLNNTLSFNLPLSLKQTADSNETISDSENNSVSLPTNQPNSQTNAYNRGRWTVEEHKKFIEGLLKYGSFWKSIQKHISTRSPAQVRSHAQKFFLMCKKKFSEVNMDLIENKDKIKQIFIEQLDKGNNDDINKEDDYFNNESIQELVQCNGSRKHKTNEKVKEKIFRIEKKTRKVNAKAKQGNANGNGNYNVNVNVNSNEVMDNDNNVNVNVNVNGNGIDIGYGNGNESNLIGLNNVLNANDLSSLSKPMNPFNLVFDSIAFSTHDNQQYLLDINNSIDNDDNLNGNLEWD